MNFERRAPPYSIGGGSGPVKWYCQDIRFLTGYLPTAIKG